MIKVISNRCERTAAMTQARRGQNSAKAAFNYMSELGISDFDIQEKKLNTLSTRVFLVGKLDCRQFLIRRHTHTPGF